MRHDRHNTMPRRGAKLGGCDWAVLSPLLQANLWINADQTGHNAEGLRTITPVIGRAPTRPHSMLPTP